MKIPIWILNTVFGAALAALIALGVSTQSSVNALQRDMAVVKDRLGITAAKEKPSSHELGSQTNQVQYTVSTF